MPGLSTEDQGQGRAFHPLLAGELLRATGEPVSPEGLKVDCETANARVGTWLREIANARVHATTGEIPLVRLEQERERLQAIPASWPGTLQPAAPKRPVPLPRGCQHPLRVYEELITAVEVG